MSILNRIAKLVKAELNYRIRQTGLGDDSDILTSDLEEEIRQLEEELRQAEEAEQRWQRAKQRNEYSSRTYSQKAKSPQKTVYDVLGVSPTAPQKVIRDKFRELAKKYHPDRVAKLSPDVQENAKQKMKEINLAYDQIEDSKKRQAYDRKIGLI